MIDGVPLRIRTANVTVERPGVSSSTRPTARSCTSKRRSPARRARSSTPPSRSRSPAARGCTSAPRSRSRPRGKTSKADGASLDAKVTYPTGAQSNIASVKVDLPKQLPSRLTTLQKACTAAQFEANPAGCPAASIIGYAKASTPELPVPLTGPAYFVSHGGEAFPSLIIVLQGYGVRIDLTAATFISKAGITSSTFKTVPDAPVIELRALPPRGPPLRARPPTATSARAKLSMPTLFTAQDGAQLKQSTKITVTGCPKAKDQGQDQRPKPKRKRQPMQYDERTLQPVPCSACPAPGPSACFVRPAHARPSASSPKSANLGPGQTQSSTTGRRSLSTSHQQHLRRRHQR